MYISSASWFFSSFSQLLQGALGKMYEDVLSSPHFLWSQCQREKGQWPKGLRQSGWSSCCHSRGEKVLGRGVDIWPFGSITALGCLQTGRWVLLETQTQRVSCAAGHRFIKKPRAVVQPRHHPHSCIYPKFSNSSRPAIYLWASTCNHSIEGLSSYIWCSSNHRHDTDWLGSFMVSRN